MTAKSILPATWKVPPVFRDRLGDKVGRQRAMFSDGHLLLVMHAPPKRDQAERSARLFWRDPQGAWAATEFGSGPAALLRHLDEYAECLERLDQLEDHAEAAQDYFVVITALAPVLRSARHLHQVLAEARKMCPHDRHVINCRDRAYDLERTAELLYADVKNGLEFAVARRAEQQAESSHRMAVSAHRLNLLAAFFFPLATLTAVFGVNLRHGLENASTPLPFLAVLSAGLLCGAVLTALIVKKPKRRAVEPSPRDRLQRHL